MVPIYLIYCCHYAHATYMGHKYMKRGNVTKNYLLIVLLSSASMDCASIFTKNSLWQRPCPLFIGAQINLESYLCNRTCDGPLANF